MFEHEVCRSLRRLVDYFSPRWPRFTHRSVRVGFVVDKVVLRQDFLLILRYLLLLSFHRCSELTFVCHWRMDTGPVGNAVTQMLSHPIATIAMTTRKASSWWRGYYCGSSEMRSINVSWKYEQYQKVRCFILLYFQ